MSIYHHKWFPRIFYKKPDGGVNSGVTGYFLIEWKSLFSIALLHFKLGSREAYHSHAFNAFTWWISGEATEVQINQETYEYRRSWQPKHTSRQNCHKVIAKTSCWALTIRGPWKDHWYEWRDGEMVTLTHGRKVI